MARLVVVGANAVSRLAVSAATALGLAACDGGAVTLTIDGDREVPGELDAMCVGIADRALTGGAFGRGYRLEGRLGRLPQTLAVAPGEASAAIAWARGYRGGVAVAFDRADLDFADDVTLRLDRCPRAQPGAIAEVAATPGTGRLLASTGQGGTVVLAVSAAGAVVVDADGTTLVTTPIAGAAGAAAVSFDADGDCDDDLVVASPTTTTLFVRDGVGFTAGASLPGATALAALDVDGDGALDLVAGMGGALVLHRNDGVGGFAPVPGAIDAGGAVSAVSALAAGDLDGDGHGDLLVGQAGAPTVALVGDPSGAGVLTLAPAVFPPVSLRVRELAPADLDGDLDLDVVVTLDGAPTRVYVNRGGRLEDQSFIRLPQPAPVAAFAAVGDWDGDCAPDLVLAAADTVAVRGGAAGAPFEPERTLGAALGAVLADLDDDGDPDLILAGASSLGWWRR